jgi:hypothetical protein
MTVRVAIKSGRTEIAVVAIGDLGPVETKAHLMRYAGKPEKYALLGPKSRSATVEMLQGIFASLMGLGLAKVEQAILTIMRSDGFLGSKWTPGELHFFLYETVYGKCDNADLPNRAWRSPALEASVRRGLASLQDKGLVKKHTMPRQGWLGLSPQITWSLGDAEMNQYSAEIKARKQVRNERRPTPAN